MEKWSVLTHHVNLPSSIAAMRKDHSITSSARASTDCGTVRPSALAVVELMTSSNSCSFNAASRNLAEIVHKVAQIVAHGTAASLFVSFTKRPVN
jgi:hypothetical protein